MNTNSFNKLSLKNFKIFLLRLVIKVYNKESIFLATIVFIHTKYYLINR